MRVTHKTDEVLVLQHRPWVLPAIFAAGAAFGLWRIVLDFPALAGRDLAGAIVGVVGLSVGAALMGGRSTFVFHAGAGVARWRHRGLVGRGTGTVPLAEIRNVTIEEDRDGDGPSYRVALVTDGRHIPLTPHFSGVEPHEANADAIRGWLEARGMPVSSARTPA